MAVKRNEILCMLQYGGTSETPCYVKGARHDGHVSYDFISMEHPGQANLQRQKGASWLPGAGETVPGSNLGEHRFLGDGKTLWM